MHKTNGRLRDFCLLLPAFVLSMLGTIAIAQPASPGLKWCHGTGPASNKQQSCLSSDVCSVTPGGIPYCLEAALPKFAREPALRTICELLARAPKYAVGTQLAFLTVPAPVNHMFVRARDQQTTRRLPVKARKVAR